MVAPLVVAACLGCLDTRPLPFAKPYLGHGHNFIVVAHRADHTKAPENTLDAIEEAIKDEVDYVELDLRLTKDGVIVLMHDGTVDRTTDGKGKVEDFTLAQIKELRIKGARRDSERVPTFDEALALIKGRLGIYMDIKSVHPLDVLPVLKKQKMEDKVVAYLYGPAHRAEWKKGAPGVPVISDISSMKSGEQIEREWKASPFAITDGNAMKYTAEFIAKWHELKVVVVPDIQNPGESPAQWRPLIDAGVDGFQTDHPGALIAYLKELGVR